MAKPRNTQGPTDPNRIDVSLDLIGADSVQRVDALIASLAGLQQQMADIASVIPERAAGGHRKLSGRVGASGVYEGGQSPNASNSGDVSPGHRDGHGQNASRPPVDDERERSLRRLGEMQNPFARVKEYREYDSQLPEDQRATGIRGKFNSFLDRQVDSYGARERDQAESRGGRQTRFTGQQGTHAGTNSYGGYSGTGDNQPRSGVSGGGSEPPAPDFMRNLTADPDRFDASQESPVIPQFGALTTPDKLNFVSDYFSRRSVAKYDRQVESAQDDKVEEGWKAAKALGFSRQQFDENIRQTIDMSDIDTSGLQDGAVDARRALLLRQGAGQASNAYAMHQSVRGAFDLARRPFDYIGGIQQQGVASGYERAGSGSFGIQNPVDMLKGGSAFREGVNQRQTGIRLRAKGGINGEQADEIVQSVTNRGYSGEYGQKMMLEGLAPLVQQGQNPEIAAAMMDKAIRNGTTSITEMRETLDNLGPAAQSAKMSLDEYQQGLDQFAEMAGEFGATYQEAVESGKAFSAGLGITPQEAGSTLASPMVQGMGMAKFGVLPQEFGALGAGEQSQSLLDAIQMMDQNTMNMPDAVDAQGNVTMSGKKRGEIMTAKNLGLDQSLVNNVRRKGQAGVQAVTAAQKLEQYNKAEEDFRQRVKERSKREGTGSNFGPDFIGKNVGEYEKQDKAFLDDQWQKLVAPDLEKIGANLKGEDRKKFDEKLRDVNSKPSGDKREKAAAELIKQYRPKPKEDQNKFTFDLTADARRLLRFKKGSKDEADAGGTSTATVAVMPQSPGVPAANRFGGGG